MHKGIILLTQAENKEEALKNIKGFMSGYENDVWYWYQIGGRWSRTLNPLNEKFNKLAENLCKDKETGDVYQSTIDEKQEELNKIWKDLGGKGLNPWTDHYNLPENGAEDDCVPLKDCIDIVKSWQQDPIKAGKNAENEARKWLNGEYAENNYSMYGFSLKKAGELYSQDFSFETNVFNTQFYNFSLPNEIENWFAIIVDMHN